MADIKNEPIVNIWASDTSNIEPSTKIDTQGILYGADIVSKQLNGALNTLSNQVAFNQYNGGQYSDDLTYNVGNIITANIDLGCGNFIVKLKCINDNAGAGIKGIKPVTNATETLQNGILYLKGDGINTQFWSILTNQTNPTTREKVSQPFKAGSLQKPLNTKCFCIPRGILPETHMGIYGIFKVKAKIDNKDFVKYSQIIQLSVSFSDFTMLYNEVTNQNSDTYPFCTLPAGVITAQPGSLMLKTDSAFLDQVFTYRLYFDYEYINGYLNDIVLKKIINTTPNKTNFGDAFSIYIPTILGLGCKSMVSIGFYADNTLNYNYSYNELNNAIPPTIYELSSGANKGVDTNYFNVFVLSAVNIKNIEILATPLPIVESGTDTFGLYDHLARMFRVSENASSRSFDTIGELQYFNGEIPDGYYWLSAWINFETQMFNGVGTASYNENWYGSSPGLANSPFNLLATNNGGSALTNFLYYNGFNSHKVQYPLGLNSQPSAPNQQYNAYYPFNLSQNGQPMGMSLGDCVNFINPINVTLQDTIDGGGNGYLTSIYRGVLSPQTDKLPAQGNTELYGGNSWGCIPQTCSTRNRNSGGGFSCPVDPNMITISIPSIWYNLRQNYGATNPAQYSSPPTIYSKLCMKIF